MMGALATTAKGIDKSVVKTKLQQSSRSCLRNARILLAHKASEYLQDRISNNCALAKTYNVHDQLILSAYRVYLSHMEKSEGICKWRGARINPNTKTYVVFEKLVNLCLENKWLFGEFISAQFLMMGKRKPLICNMSTEGAINRYHRYVKMFKGKNSLLSTTSSEKETIERSVKSSCRNITTIMLARNSAVYQEQFLTFCDRYTLCVFGILGTIKSTELISKIREEMDNIKTNTDKLNFLIASCKIAAKTRIKDLLSDPKSTTTETIQLKQDISKVISSLYRIE